MNRGAARSHRGTLISLAFATAIGSAGLAAGGTSGALLGAEVSGTEAMAGVPLGMLVVGQAVASLVISSATSRLGRRRSLALGYLLGVVGTVVVILAATSSSLTLLLSGTAVLGAGNAAVFLTRYAAAEASDEATRGSALGTVLFAAALGAIVSPNLLGPGGDLDGLLGLQPLAGLYVIAIFCYVVAAAFLVYPSSETSSSGVGRERVSRMDIASGLRSGRVRTALSVLAVTNLVMVAVMAIAPVHLAAHGHGLGLVGTVVAVHVAGMFLPSPVTGWMVDKFGALPVISSGAILLVASGVSGVLMNPDNALDMAVVLILLGLGWNCGVVGGSAMLSASVTPKLRPRVEGFGEVSMGLAAGAGAPAAGMVAALGGFAALSILGAATVVATAILFTLLSTTTQSTQI